MSASLSILADCVPTKTAIAKENTNKAIILYRMIHLLPENSSLMTIKKDIKPYHSHDKQCP